MIRLSEYFAKHRKDIFSRWQTMAHDDDALRSANSLSYRQFRDHIPAVLDELESKLRKDETDSEKPLDWAKHELAKHGFHRWQQGYKLSEVARDWAHLHLALLELVEAYVKDGGPQEAAVKAYRLIAQLMHHGGLESTIEYEKLRKAEAAAHLEEMKHHMLLVGENEPTEAIDFSHIIHDLRHEVSLVAGATDLFNTDMDDKARKRAMHYMRHGISSLESMVGDLMTLARLNSGYEDRKLTQISPVSLLEDILGKCQPTAKQLGLYLEFHGEFLPDVRTDRSKMTRILQNLLINALKYTQVGGVTVSWGKSNIAEHWFVRIEDTGPGLADQSHPPFVEHLVPVTRQEKRFSDSEQNTVVAEKDTSREARIRSSEGLGLSIVKRLCEILDATLELDPDYTEGTRLTVHLPFNYDK